MPRPYDSRSRFSYDESASDLNPPKALARILGGMFSCLGVSASFARLLALFAVLGLTMALDPPPPRCSNEIGAVYYAVSLQVKGSIGARGASPSGGEASKSHRRPLPTVQLQPIAARKRRPQYVHEPNSRNGGLGMSYCLGESGSTALCGAAGMLRELVVLGCASSCQLQRAPSAKLLNLQPSSSRLAGS